MKQKNLILKFVGLFLFFLLSVCVLQTAKAYAFTAADIHPNPGPVQLPPFFVNGLVNDCNKLPPQSPATNNWLSEVGNPAGFTVPVTYGQASINLQVNSILANCWPNSDALEVYTLYDNARDGAGGTFSGINNNSTLLDAKPSTDVGHFDEQNFAFTYAPAGGFRTSGAYNITVDYYPAYHARNGSYKCITGGDMSGFGFAFIKFPRPVGCNPAVRTFQIFVSVGPAPQGSIVTMDCDVIQGWAVDGRDENANLRVHIYKDFLPGFGGVDIAGGLIANQKNPNGSLLPYPGSDPAFPGPIPGYHGFSLNISAYKDSTVHHFFIFVDGVTGAPGDVAWINSGGPTEATDSPGVPCQKPVMTCSEPGFGILDSFFGSDIGTILEASQNFKIKVGVSYPGPAKTGSTGTVEIHRRNPDGSVGGLVSPPGTIGGLTYSKSSGNQYNATTPSAVSVATTGQYYVIYTFSYTGAPAPVTSSPCPITVVQKPYLRVYGNDVQAGGAFATAPSSICGAVDDPAASIYGLGQQFGIYIGAGAQLGVSALGSIQDFDSAATRNNLATGVPPDPHGPPNPLDGTTFGNKQASGSATFGGDSGLSHCIPDYYSAHTASPITFPNNQALGNNTFGLKGLLTPKALDNAPHLAMFVNGDLRVIGDITFGGYPDSTQTSWPDIDTIPSLYVIVKGDIFIDGSVSQLDGVYIAQPIDATHGGHIYTCYDAKPGNTGTGPPSSTPYPSNNLLNTCGKKLTITGAFIAKDVRFGRVNGTVLKSNGINESSGSPNIAEVFDFSQEIYLAPLPKELQAVVGGTGSNTQYDSITSLPPVL